MSRVLAVALGVTLAFAAPTPSHAAGANPCPIIGRSSPAPDPSGTAAATKLAPAAATAAWLCHYAGLKDELPVSSLVFSKQVTEPRSLARLLNRAKHQTRGVWCSMDTGGQDVVVFATKGARIHVVISTSGCRFATSPQTRGTWRLSATAFAALAELDAVFATPTQSGVRVRQAQIRRAGTACGRPRSILWAYGQIVI